MKVIVVDDDKIVSSSLKVILEADPEIEVIALGESGEEAVKLYNKFVPDIIVMDIRMESLSGLEAGERIIKEAPNAKILFLTTFLDDEYIIKALSIGAKGYMLKQNFDSLITAIKAIINGQNVYGTEIITKLPELLKNNSSKGMFEDKGISEKEYTIIEKISDGMSNKEIAEVLFLGEGTVRNYISQILEKLELRDRTQIAVFYYKNI